MAPGLVVLAVGYQWFYNGANFLAFKVGGDAFHPLMLATLRFGIAALLVLPVAAWRWRRHRASSGELASAAVLGPVMLIGGQTLSIWGTHFLPAGIASVFGSAAPIFMALFAWSIMREPLGGRQLGGVTLGFTGLAAIAWLSSTQGEFSPVGALLTLTGAAMWAGGSLVAARTTLPQDPVIGLAAQLVPTGLLLVAGVWATGNLAAFHPATVEPRAWGTLAFLVVASTLVGYAVFMMLSRSVSPLLANSFNYAAPVIALLLSALLLGEPLGWPKLAAAGMTLAGVTLMVGGSKRQTQLETRLSA